MHQVAFHLSRRRDSPFRRERAGLSRLKAARQTAFDPLRTSAPRQAAATRSAASRYSPRQMMIGRKANVRLTAALGDRRS
jgi:hypothetical protein